MKYLIDACKNWTQLTTLNLSGNKYNNIGFDGKKFI